MKCLISQVKIEWKVFTLLLHLGFIQFTYEHTTMTNMEP